MKKMFLALSLLLPLFTIAHPGHGDDDGFTIIHYIKEPVHAIPLIGALVVTILLYRSLRRMKQRS
ncbi:MAG: hypothetical protein JST86_19460 [Bacteroidetes bacterium]|nr:hypothetical protein [Bacteroidota bacterium]